MKIRRILLAAFGFLLFVSSVLAEGTSRPKIGLVLGGGGARGAAHIGVLKVLEKNRVPIDFVVGTSMGSIVGGLYAAGMSPDEIETQINNIDWVDMFKDRPSEEYLSFRNKKDEQRLAALEMGVKDGKVALPRGIMAGQKLGLELKKLTLPVADITDFDKLNIPFRAVATNLRTGEPVVLKSGILAEAMRASMSIPGAWPPVQLDGKTLVDGFLVANVPVEIAKELGADVIIAVDVGAPLSEAENFESLIDVIGQMTAILSQQNIDKSLALLTDRDLLINPKLPGISPASFTSMPDAVKKGEEAARVLTDKIKSYAVSEQDYKQFLAKHRRTGSFEKVIDEIRIIGLQRVAERQVRGRIRTATGKPLDPQLLQQDMTRIYAMGDFESVDYTVIQQEGKNVLVVAPKEKPWGPNYLRFGLNLASDTGGDTDFTALVDYRMRQINSLGAEWKNVLEIGSTRGYFSEFYQPIDPQDYFFVAPSFRLRQEFVDVYDGDSRIAQYEKDTLEGGIGMGVNFRSYAQARIDYFVGRISAKPDIGATTLPELKDIKEGALKFTLDYDQLDNHKFPKDGIRSVVTFYDSSPSLGGEFSYQKLDFAFIKATTPKPRHTFLGSLRFGTTLDQDAPYYDDFKLGGFLNLSGYGENQLRGQQRGLGQLLYYYKFGSDPLGSGGNLYLGAGLEYGGVWNDLSDVQFSDTIASGLIFVGVDTPLGPLYLGFARAEHTSDGRFYLYLGKTF